MEQGKQYDPFEFIQKGPIDPGKKDAYNIFMASLKNGTYGIQEVQTALDKKLIEPEEHQALLHLLMEKRR